MNSATFLKNRSRTNTVSGNYSLPQNSGTGEHQSSSNQQQECDSDSSSQSSVDVSGTDIKIGMVQSNQQQQKHGMLISSKKNDSYTNVRVIKDMDINENNDIFEEEKVEPVGLFEKIFKKKAQIFAANNNFSNLNNVDQLSDRQKQLQSQSLSKSEIERRTNYQFKGYPPLTKKQKKAMFKFKKCLKQAISIWQHPYTYEMLVLRQGNKLSRYQVESSVIKPQNYKKIIDAKMIGLRSYVRGFAVSQDGKYLATIQRQRFALTHINGIESLFTSNDVTFEQSLAKTMVSILGIKSILKVFINKNYEIILQVQVTNIEWHIYHSLQSGSELIQRLTGIKTIAQINEYFKQVYPQHLMNSSLIWFSSLLFTENDEENLRCYDFENKVYLKFKRTSTNGGYHQFASGEAQTSMHDYLEDPDGIYYH